MKFPPFTFLTCILLTTLTASRASADSWIGDSLELQAADAQVIVTGTLGPTEKVATEDFNGFRATLQITQTLKAERPNEPDAKTVQCYMPHAYERYFDAWQKDKTPLLVFLVPTDRYRPRGSKTPVPVPLAVRQPPNAEPTGIIPFDGTAYSRAPTQDFKLLTKPDDILRAVTDSLRAAAQSKVQRQSDGTFPSLTVNIPIDSPLDTALHSMSSNSLVVPISDRMEGDARQWIKSDILGLREDGVKVLAQFKSPENIALLKGLLADPVLTERHSADGRIEMIFPVRHLATEALRAWGVDIAPPAATSTQRSK